MALLLDRPVYLHTLREKLRLNPIVSILGPRQVGKTTIARQVAAAGKSHYFDLEDSRSLARLENPAMDLEPFESLVIIDEIQRPSSHSFVCSRLGYGAGCLLRCRSTSTSGLHPGSQRSCSLRCTHEPAPEAHGHFRVDPGHRGTARERLPPCWRDPGRVVLEESHDLR
jgi:hypothetical protein